MASGSIGSDGGPRMSSQGSSTNVPTQMPYGMGAPSPGDSAPLVPQTLRGFARSGIGGKSNGTGNSVPTDSI